ncbi:MarR family transcriptional regulator [Paraeggerthella hongkongensis]|nr:MarR family transcriptional regulator [Paraeggerthella hongkongensis]
MDENSKCSNHGSEDIETTANRIVDEPALDVNVLIYEKLVALQHLLIRRRFAVEGGSPLADPTRGQGRILALLKVKDGVSTKDMSNVLDIRTSSLNELLGKLEGKGYVSREQSEEDGRVMVVKLTDKGRAVKQPSAKEGPADMFDCLEEFEKELFGSYLDRVVTVLEDEIDECEEGGLEAVRRQREEAFRRLFGEDDRFDAEEGLPHFAAFGALAHFEGFDSFGGKRRDGRDGTRRGGRRGGSIHEGV